MAAPFLCWLQVAVEQQYQQLCEAWKAELDEKQQQFEQARAQILEPRCAGCRPPQQKQRRHHLVACQKAPLQQLVPAVHKTHQSTSPVQPSLIPAAVLAIVGWFWLVSGGLREPLARHAQGSSQDNTTATENYPPRHHSHPTLASIAVGLPESHPATCDAVLV